MTPENVTPLPTDDVVGVLANQNATLRGHNQTLAFQLAEMTRVVNEPGYILLLPTPHRGVVVYHDPAMSANTAVRLLSEAIQQIAVQQEAPGDNG